MSAVVVGIHSCNGAAKYPGVRDSPLPHLGFRWGWYVMTGTQPATWVSRFGFRR